MVEQLDIIIAEENIKKRIKELGEKITADYNGKEIIAIGILKGAWVFMADIVREINIPVICDFLGVSSYGDGVVSSEKITLISDIRVSVGERDVLLIDDIIDTGFSINFAKEHIKSKKPTSIKLCILLNKPGNRKVDIRVDYAGFTVPDKFIVGYGLDYAEKYRNLPYIAAIK